MKSPASIAFDSVAAMSIPVAVPIDASGRPSSDAAAAPQRPRCASSASSPLKVGDRVETPYGPGSVSSFRHSDGVYRVELSGSIGTLYTTTVSVGAAAAADGGKRRSAMELNVAYESLEAMRRLNLEMECHECGIENPDLDLCRACLLEGGTQRNHFAKLQKFVDDNSTESTRKLRRLWAMGTGEENAARPKVLPRIQRLMDKGQKQAASPCLICAHRCCGKHSSAGFRKEGIALCLDCERFFELDFIVDCVSNADGAARQKSVDHMVDLYDRCLLLLRYSSQFIDAVAEGLNKNTDVTNKVGLGSSSVGVVSGVLGIAAAATILSPAGPPLLVASLVFGGSATAVQTGADLTSHFSEPRKVADRIIALHGMAHSLLRVIGTLRDACCLDHIRIEAYTDGDGGGKMSPEQLRQSIQKNRTAIEAGARATTGAALGGAIAAESAAVATAEVGVMGAARTSTALTRGATAAGRAMRFARFAGGALSAAILVLEAKNMEGTIKSIKAGSPCEKAELLVDIKEEVESFPPSEKLDEECRAYMRVLDQQNLRLTEEGSSGGEGGETIPASAPPATVAPCWDNAPKVDL